MFTYILFLIAVLFAVGNGCVLHSFDNRDIKNTGDTFFFNGGISAIWIVLLFGFSMLSNDFVISKGSIFYGAIYGFIICAFLLLKNLALTSGPVSLTILIGSCPFILTTLYGVLFRKQSIDGYQIAGIILILISLFLCISPKKGEAKFSAKWLIYCLLFFFAGGGVGILYMVFGASEAASEINGMMFCASIVACVLYFVVGTILNIVNGQPRPQIYKSGIVFILLCGIMSCTYMRLNLYLSTVIPAVVFFPVSNGLNVILSAVAGWVMYKEKLTKIQIAGMVLGLIAIVITGSGSVLAGLIWR